MECHQDIATDLRFLGRLSFFNPRYYFCSGAVFALALVWRRLDKAGVNCTIQCCRNFGAQQRHHDGRAGQRDTVTVGRNAEIGCKWTLPIHSKSYGRGRAEPGSRRRHLVGIMGDIALCFGGILFMERICAADRGAGSAATFRSAVRRLLRSHQMLDTELARVSSKLAVIRKLTISFWVDRCAWLVRKSFPPPPSPSPLRSDERGCSS